MEGTNRFSNMYFPELPLRVEPTWLINSVFLKYLRVQMQVDSVGQTMYLQIQFSVSMISWEQSFSLDCKLNSVTYICYHKFIIIRHNSNCSNPSCLCFTGTEDIEHFLLQCPHFAMQHRYLHDLVSSLSNFEIMHLSSEELSNLLLFSHPNFMLVTYCAIVESTIKFIKSSRRFKTNQSSCQNLLAMIATLLFVSSLLLSFSSDAQLLSLCTALFIKIV